MSGRKAPDNQIVLYTTPDGRINIEALFDHENLWLTQKRMAELFECSTDNISLHVRNIYKERELDEKATTEDSSVVQTEGKRQVTRPVTLYSLEMIIAVGYRVNSEKGTLFRQWATTVLHNYIQKEYALDNDRFKYGSKFSTRYFDELLEEIRDIRSSERLSYQKITDIYATSVDYSPTSEETQTFFKTVQNKLHFAITGETSAELVAHRADSTKPHMGLTSWRRGPGGKIMSSDITVAKDYLSKDELDRLNRIIPMYIDYAEFQATKNIPMYMKDWRQKLDAFLQFNEFDILNDNGKVSHAVAAALAEKEYDKFKPV